MPSFPTDTHIHRSLEHGTQKVALDSSGNFVANEDQGDFDFRVESDTNANAIMLDAGVYGGVGSLGIGAAPAATPIAAVLIDLPALTAPANTNFATVHIDNTAAKTIPTGTAAVVCALRVDEPNITATGTVTDAATVYIEAAPTEGGTGNFALWVDSGITRLDGQVLIGGPSATVVHNLNTATAVVFNEQGADIDLRVEGDNNANLLTIDAGVYGGVGGIAFGTDHAQASSDAFIVVNPPALTSVANDNFFRMYLGNANAITVPTGTSGYVGTLNIDEPNITATGTVTNAFTVRIAGAPTEGGTVNVALWVDADVTRLDGDLDLDSGTGLIRHNVTAGITASTTQTQGNGALTAEVNEVATVANANDTVTLPSAVAGYRVVIINNGANTLRIFPASGDDLGAGVDTSTTLAAGSNVVYQAYNATNWESI